MAVVKSLEHLVDVESYIVVREALVEGSEVYIPSINVLHDERWCLSHWIPHHIDKINDIDSSLECLQDLDLSSNFCLFNWLEDLDDDSFIVERINSLINLRVLSSSNLLDDFIVFLGAEMIVRESMNNTYPNLTSKFS